MLLSRVTVRGELLHLPKPIPDIDFQAAGTWAHPEVFLGCP